MRKLFTIITLVAAINVNAQQVGIGAYYGTNETTGVEVVARLDKGFLKLGYSWQQNNRLGESLTQFPEVEYTAEIANYYNIFDIGYGARIGKFTVEYVVSLGWSNNAINYTPENMDTYHIKTDTKFIQGGGVNLGFDILDNVSVFAGHSIIKKGQSVARFGLRWFLGL